LASAGNIERIAAAIEGGESERGSGLDWFEGLGP
jgi:hypothetical protein